MKIHSRIPNILQNAASIVSGLRVEIRFKGNNAAGTIERSTLDVLEGSASVTASRDTEFGSIEISFQGKLFVSPSAVLV